MKWRGEQVQNCTPVNALPVMAPTRRESEKLRHYGNRKFTKPRLECCSGWVLKNGSIYQGMPSFAHLPEPQRWEIITFLRSLNAPALTRGGRRTDGSRRYRRPRAP